MLELNSARVALFLVAGPHSNTVHRGGGTGLADPAAAGPIILANTAILATLDSLSTEGAKSY